MSNLSNTAQRLVQAVSDADSRRASEATREYIEQVTFATADDIVAMLRESLGRDWSALPPWARNLAYRLACLQRPDDAGLLREAAADLLSFGPDWDEHAERLKEQANRLSN
ncbi:hypothetical protein M1L60_24045 [Actinoplanes sp. TRM 88003]|uniref:Uncharacterized protein n=1 Tax=Paractinoplanes aksuensis TaxID=2939490 RepID=A0ABT1DS57_9ACTN|nr:hypothetical protein [Actinoplanes aksuensis]MCO8273672.1 hypothetical protein [Actinoplanes aksuensis]